MRLSELEQTRKKVLQINTVKDFRCLTNLANITITTFNFPRKGKYILQLKLHERENDMNREDAYYEPDDSEDRTDEIEERVATLMKTKVYDPFIAGNIVEAMGELSVQQAEDLQDCLDLKDFEMIGRKIWAITYDYMERYALEQAENEICED